MDTKNSQRPAPREPGKAVVLGCVLVLTYPNFNDLFIKKPRVFQKLRNQRQDAQIQRIRDYFYMDTFFATKKGGRSTRGHTCCQSFVTDKGVVYLVPLKRKGEVLLAVKQFAKEIGAWMLLWLTCLVNRCFRR
jgi:hypothetical protein